MMTQAGNKLPHYTLNFSRRASRIRLRVTPGRVVVTAPVRTSRTLIDLFVRSRVDWIREKLAVFNSVKGPSAEIEPVNGAPVWVLGKRLVLASLPGDGYPVIKGGTILVGEQHLSVLQLRKWLDIILLDAISSKIDECSAILGVAPERIRLGNAVSRWGSCSSKGVIMINRKLVHAPVFAVDYIAAHEMAHLVHRNHSARFHLELGRLGVEVQKARKWLRLQGAFLIQ